MNKMANKMATDLQSLRLPLGRLALCLDCEMCFEVGPGACPACGSATWIPIASFLERSTRLMARQQQPA